VIASRLVYSILLVNTHNAAKPPSALNVTLSYLLLSAGALLQHGACSAPAAIDLYCLPAGRSAANSPTAVAAVDRRDRQTDGRTLNQCIDPARAASAKSVSCRNVCVSLGGASYFEPCQSSATGCLALFVTQHVEILP